MNLPEKLKKSLLPRVLCNRKNQEIRFMSLSDLPTSYGASDSTIGREVCPDEYQIRMLSIKNHRLSLYVDDYFLTQYDFDSSPDSALVHIADHYIRDVVRAQPDRFFFRTPDIKTENNFTVYITMDEVKNFYLPEEHVYQIDLKTPSGWLPSIENFLKDRHEIYRLLYDKRTKILHISICEFLIEIVKNGESYKFDKIDRLRHKLKENLKPVHNIGKYEPIAIESKNEKRALETLREMITEKQYRQYLKKGFISVQGKSGMTYQIFKNKWHTKVWNKGILAQEICTRIKTDLNIPATDNVIAFKTLISACEKDFTDSGNVYKMQKVA